MAYVALWTHTAGLTTRRLKIERLSILAVLLALMAARAAGLTN